MKWIFVLPIAWSMAGAATAQSNPELYIDRSKIDVSACTPQNPNCDCNPKKNTCWFKLPDQQQVYFDKSTMKIITRAQYEAQ